MRGLGRSSCPVESTRATPSRPMAIAASASPRAARICARAARQDAWVVRSSGAPISSLSRANGLGLVVAALPQSASASSAVTVERKPLSSHPQALVRDGRSCSSAAGLAREEVGERDRHAAGLEGRRSWPSSSRSARRFATRSSVALETFSRRMRNAASMCVTAAAVARHCRSFLGSDGRARVPRRRSSGPRARSPAATSGSARARDAFPSASPARPPARRPVAPRAQLPRHVRRMPSRVYASASPSSRSAPCPARSADQALRVRRALACEPPFIVRR